MFKFKDCNVETRKKTFATEYGSYFLNLEEFIFSDYKINENISDEFDEYKHIGDFCLNLPTDSIIIDIGANYGLSAFPPAIRGYNVIGFEPVEINYFLLNKSIEENNLQEKIKTHKLALSNKDEISKIYVPCYRDNCSLNKDSAVLNMNKTKDFSEETIRTMKFDSWLDQNKEVLENKIKFIKSDTQGYESAIIEGMSGFIDRNSDFYILLEWDKNLAGNAGFSLDKLYNFLLSNNFEEKTWINEDKLFYKNKSKA